MDSAKETKEMESLRDGDEATVVEHSTSPVNQPLNDGPDKDGTENEIKNKNDLTPKATENSFDFIKRQLSIMNEGSGELTTNIHMSENADSPSKSSKKTSVRRKELYKSPLKVVKLVKSRGMKRRRNQRNFRKLKIKLSSKSTKSETFSSSSDDDDAEIDDSKEEEASTLKKAKMDHSEESSVSDEEGWKILEDSDTEVDKIVKENAQKIKLSSSNVKKLLHQVITNEHVVAMVKSTLLAEEPIPDVEVEPAHFEPKMTRSKFKHLMKKDGDIPHPWPLSPLKKGRKSPVASFLEVEFPDDEEDDDFDPEKEVLLSDEDSESMTSSQVSDYGSPLPSTPRTPTSVKASDMDVTPTSESGLLSPMGPPKTSFVLSTQKMALSKKYRDAMQEEEEKIALRTRSKLSLAQTSLTEIESNFVAPDITPDMYDTYCDDQEWQSFLSSLVKPAVEIEDTNDVCDDDPEYDFLEDITKEWVDKEDFRSDRAVQVSKREVNDLMDELIEASEDLESVPAEEKAIMKAQVCSDLHIDMSKKKPETPSLSPKVNMGALTITQDERLQLADQMRKYVQILSQLYVLSQSDKENQKNLLDQSVYLLKEIKDFSNGAKFILKEKSAFHAENLDDALALVNKPLQWNKTNPREPQQEPLTSLLLNKYDSLSKSQKDEILDLLENKDDEHHETNAPPYGKHGLCPLTCQQQHIFMTSPVFLYPHLLPTCRLIVPDLMKPKQRIVFTEAEDNLLALGYEQFRKFPLHRELIQKFLLPNKSSQQIMIRIKNLSSRGEESAVKKFKKFKALPEFPRYGMDFTPGLLRPLKEKKLDYKCPWWCKELRIREIVSKTAEGGKISHEMRRACSVNLPICLEKKIDLNRKVKSAPASPIQLIKEIKNKFSPRKVLHQLKNLRNKGNARQRQQAPMFSNASVTLTPVTNAMMAGEDSVDAHISFKNDHHSSHGTASTPTSASLMQSVVLPSSSVIIVNSNGVLTTPSIPLLDCQSSPVLLGNNAAVPDVGAVHLHVSENSQIYTTAQDTMVTTSIVMTSTMSTTLSSTNHVSLVSVLPVPVVSTSTSALRTSTASSVPAVCQSVSSTTEVDSLGLNLASPQHPQDLSLPQCSSIPSVHANELTPPKNVNPQSPAKSHPQASPAPKTALEIMASYAPFIYSPSTNNPSQAELSRLNQMSQEKTPTKKTTLTPRFRPLVPSPFSTSPSKTVTPFLQKSPSPRRKQLVRKAQNIRPKGLVIKNYISPVKKAASSIMQKVLKRGGPKTLHRSVVDSAKLREERVIDSQDEDDENGRNDTTSEYDTMESEWMSDDGLESEAAGAQSDKPADQNISSVSGTKLQVRRKRRLSEMRKSLESDDTQSETDDLYDSQVDEEDEEQVGGDTGASVPGKKLLERKMVKSRPKKKRESSRSSILAMAGPELVESDPLKDDRDTAFAQAYLCRVKEVLKDDLAVYESFLRTLYVCGQQQLSTVQLYKELNKVLKDYPELIYEFAGFLLPEQAVECDCFMATQEFSKARLFLRKLEIHFEKNPSQFQKCVKLLSKWYKKPDKSYKELKDQMESMLRGQTHLLEELSLFFGNERPPESHMTDFEEINFSGSEGEEMVVDSDGFEIVKLPEEEETAGTKKCQCKCHSNSLDANFWKRNKHCYNCCLKVIDGELYFHVNSKTLKKVKVIFHKPVKAQFKEIEARTLSVSPTVTKEPNSKTSWVDDAAAEKENVDIRIVDQKKKPLSLKMKISSKKKSKSRFLNLSELADGTSSGEASRHSVPSDSDSKDSQISNPEPQLENNSCSKQSFEKSSSHVSSGDSTLKSAEKVPTSSFEKIQAVESTESLGALINLPSPSHDGADCSMTPVKLSTARVPANLLGVLDEPASLTPQKSQSRTVTLMSQPSTPPKSDSSSSMSQDILARAVQDAMIGQNDISVDGFHSVAPVQVTVMQTGPECQSFYSVANTTMNPCYITVPNTLPSAPAPSPHVAVRDTKYTDSGASVTGENFDLLKTLTTGSFHTSGKPAPQRSFRKNLRMSAQKPQPLMKNMVPRQTLTMGPGLQTAVSCAPVQVTNQTSTEFGFLGAFAQGNSACVQFPGPNVTTTSSITHSAGVTNFVPAPTPPVLDAENGTERTGSFQQVDTKTNINWTRDMDAIILEMVKTHGNSESTFQQLSERFGNKTPEEVSKRLQSLLEFISDSTQSEDDTEDDKSGSSV